MHEFFARPFRMLCVYDELYNPNLDSLHYTAFIVNAKHIEVKFFIPFE